MFLFISIIVFVFSLSTTDDFVFEQNNLYFQLVESLEGRIILGIYQNTKVLLERPLKLFIMQRVIEENPLIYK